MGGPFKSDQNLSSFLYASPFSFPYLIEMRTCMLTKVHGLVWFIVCLFVCSGVLSSHYFIIFRPESLPLLVMDSEAIHDVIIPNCSFTTECSTFKELHLNCSFTTECSAFKELHLNCSFTTERSAFKELRLLHCYIVALGTHCVLHV